jgi:hypothetical protein
MKNQDENLDHSNQEEQNRTAQTHTGNTQDKQGQGIIPEDQIEGSDADTDKQVSPDEIGEDFDHQNEQTEAAQDE